MNRIFTGETRAVMRQLIDDGVKAQCVVTSPPYWGLRCYGTDPVVWGGDSSCEHDFGINHHIHRTGGVASSGLGDYGNSVDQEDIDDKVARGTFTTTTTTCSRCGAWRGELGLEPNPWMYVEHMMEVFDLVRDILADDGLLFLNIGDTYITRPTGSASRFLNGNGTARAQAAAAYRLGRTCRSERGVLKMKDMALIPQRLAIALQDRGWWVRQDIIWHKTNAMPGSYKDRFTSAHEYVWMLAKSEHYFFDTDSILEPASPNTNARMARAHGGYVPPGQDRRRGILAPRENASGVNPKARASSRRPSGWAEGDQDRRTLAGRFPRVKQNESFSAAVVDKVEFRRKRDVWSIPSEPFKGHHYATFPQALVKPCILAGSRPGDIVFDPFMGSGTVARVAVRTGRRYIGIDLDHRNEGLQRQRLENVQMEAVA